MFRNNPARQGLYNSPQLPEEVDKKWIFRTEGIIQSSPVIHEGVVYFGNNDEKVYAIDADTGHEVWHFSAEERVKSTPAIMDNILYTGCLAGYLYALDIKNGGELSR